MKNLTSWIGGLSLVVLLLIIVGLFLLGKRTFYPENEYYTNVAVTESRDINYDDYCTREKVDVLIAENDTLRAKLDLLLLKQYDLDEQRAIFSNELAKTNMFYTLFVTIFGVFLTVFITWYVGWKLPKEIKDTTDEEISKLTKDFETANKLRKLHDDKTLIEINMIYSTLGLSFETKKDYLVALVMWVNSLETSVKLNKENSSRYYKSELIGIKESLKGMLTMKNISDIESIQETDYQLKFFDIINKTKNCNQKNIAIINDILELYHKLSSRK